MAISLRAALAGIAAAGGLLAAFSGSPYMARHAVIDVDRLAAAVAHEEDHVTAIELAQWLHDRKPGLRIIDLRTAAEFEEYHLPRAERVAIESLASTPFRATDTLVVVSGGGTHAGQAWVLLQALGYRQVYFLRGGLQEWIDDVMNPTIAADAPPEAVATFRQVSAISRYFGGVPRVLEKGVDKGRALRDHEGSGDSPSSSSSSSSTSSSPSSSSTSSSTGSTAAAIRRRGC